MTVQFFVISGHSPCAVQTCYPGPFLWDLGISLPLLSSTEPAGAAWFSLGPKVEQHLSPWALLMSACFGMGLCSLPLGCMCTKPASTTFGPHKCLPPLGKACVSNGLCESNHQHRLPSRCLWLLSLLGDRGGYVYYSTYIYMLYICYILYMLYI